MVGLGLSLVFGCTSAPDGGETTGFTGASTGWWETSGTGGASMPATISGPSGDGSGSAGPGSSTGQPASTSSSAETEQTEEPEPDEVGVFGFAQVTASTSLLGEEELVVFIDGEDLCLVTWELSSMVPNDTCPLCEFAFDVVRSAPVIDVDVACDDYVDLAAVPTMLSLGYGDSTLYVDDGRGWQARGEAELFPRRGLLELEWFIPQ